MPYHTFLGDFDVYLAFQRGKVFLYVSHNVLKSGYKRAEVRQFG